MTSTPRWGLVVGLVALLAALHQDFWLWENSTLIMGFIPAGLAYHAGFSLLATLTWAVVVMLVWPSDPAESSEESS